MALTTVRPQGMGFVTGRRNLIINGAMQVAQRGTSATSVSSEGYKCVDRMRWTMDSTSAVFTLSQSTDVPSGQGFAKSFKAEVTTADTSLAAGNQTRFEYRFEGQDLQQLAKGTSNAKKVTLSFWVKAYQTGTYVINLQDTDNSRLIAATYTVDTSATWEYKTVTFVGDTSGAFTNDANLSAVVHWYLGAGSTYTSGTLPSTWESLTNANRAAGQTVDIATSTSNYWAITGIQLELGENASDFEHRSFGEELALCQRYCQVWNFGSSYQGGGGFSGAIYSADLAFVTVPYFCEMRASPTGTISDKSTWQLINPSDAPDAVNSISMYGQSKTSATIQVDPSTSASTPTASATSGCILWPDNSSSTDATVRLDAEL
jgi:hypothetical protein